MSRALTALLTILLAACSTASKHQPGAPEAPVMNSAEAAAALKKEMPNVAVVLGPGGAKAFAHAGVIKEFQENHIPIDRIVGIEWGSLIAAAFAAHGQSHEIDWKLYRLDQVDLSSAGGFLGFGHDRSIKVLDGYFHDNFGDLDFSAMKLPFSCPARSYWSGTLVWQHKGLVADALRKCMPFPPLLKLHGGWLSAATQIRDVIEELKAEGYKLIVFVDVLGTESPFGKEKPEPSPSDVLLWQDVQRSMLEAEAAANEVVRVSTDGISFDRFDQRKELQQRGEQEGLRSAQRLSAKYGF
jgi:predicted acylesterase/phospholipase RssA